MPHPVRAQPEFSIEGQNGLFKHVMLNDRKRVLTVDTAGEVLLWDLLKCVPIKSFGKRDLDVVKAEITTDAMVANWCSVDTRTGTLAVTLEENNCFDAEMYADELELDEDIEFRDDQRINLGKWVLRYLFSNLITEEIKRDQVFRNQLLSTKEEQRLQRDNAPTSIQLPQPTALNGWHNLDNGAPSASTVKPTNGYTTVQTPGLAIGQATPGAYGTPIRAVNSNNGTRASEDGEPLDRRVSSNSQRKSVDRNSDYFSSSRLPNTELMSPGGITAKAPVTPGEGAEEPTTPAADGATPSKDTPSKGLFGKKFRTGMSFSGMKKIGRAEKQVDKDKPAIVEEKDETESDSHSSKTSNSRVVEDNLLGTVQKLRYFYEDSLTSQIQSQQALENGLPGSRKSIDVPTGITPSLPAETPVLKPPLNTTILIQEDRPEAGGVADLFEGTVGALGEKCDVLERTAPMWLGEVLLRNQIPQKDIVKISFVLEPFKEGEKLLLPSIADDGNNRLNANRMLRAKKILAYVAERIEPGLTEEKQEKEQDTLRPEEYLELWCQNQVSLAYRSTQPALPTNYSHRSSRPT